MTGLLIDGVSHIFGSREVLADVSLSVAAGDIACLLGPSGCGKTTLLRIAAGLEPLQTGTVIIGNRVVADNKGQLPPEKRGIGLMFQDFALFPHLTVSENVMFGLADWPTRAAKSRATDVLAQVGMADCADEYPHTLSGGQQQRVALARALAPEPGVMLLDEPFSGLDQSLRVQVREDTVNILKDTGAATLIVTHHPEEALFMGDHLQVMSPEGRILQSGLPTEVYTKPAHPFVASFFGPVNRLTGVARGGQVETPLGAVDAAGCEDGAEVEIIIRHGGFDIQFEGRSGDGGGIAIEVVAARPLGRTTHIRFRVAGAGHETYQARVPGLHAEEPGKAANLRIIPDNVFVYRRDGEA